MNLSSTSQTSNSSLILKSEGIVRFKFLIIYQKLRDYCLDQISKLNKTARMPNSTSLSTELQSKTNPLQQPKRNPLTNCLKGLKNIIEQVGFDNLLLKTAKTCHALVFYYREIYIKLKEIPFHLSIIDHLALLSLLLRSIFD